MGVKILLYLFLLGFAISVATFIVLGTWQTIIPVVLFSAGSLWLSYESRKNR